MEARELMSLAAELASTVPAAVIRRAREILSNQNRMPTSPGRQDHCGRVVFCAAAAIAAAGAELLLNDETRSQLERRIAADEPKTILYEYFYRLGWSESLCERAFTTNDKLDPDIRRVEIIELLRDAEHLASRSYRGPHAGSANWVS
jgi:hypothetical protein